MTDAVLRAISPARSDELESPARRALRRLVKRKGAVAGLVVITAFILLALFAPLIVPYDPIATSWSLVRKPPSALHWFGTDDLGRDILARVIFGARASLMAGAISVGIALCIGVPLGLLSGYRGGFVDALISRITDAMLACPFLILAIALAAFLGPSLGNAMIAIGISATPIFIRLTRGQVMSVKVEDYVEAARAMGNPPWRIALFHILPNIMPALLVQATLSIAAAIIAEAALSFLGLGQQPPAPSWGSMLNAAQRFLTNAPWMALWPGLAIFLVVLSLNLVGDGLRDALDPRASGAERPLRLPSELTEDSSRLACDSDSALDHHLPQHPAAIHLVFEIDHRRPREVPNEARTRGAAPDDGLGKDRVEVMDGVGLRRRRILPAEAELGHALFHHADDVANLLRQTFRAQVAVAHRPLRVASGSLLQLAATRDHEGRRRGGSRTRERERME